MSAEDALSLDVAKLLTHVEGEVREKTVQKIVRYLKLREKSVGRLDDLELQRLWKALYYCFWMTDKVPVQLEMGRTLAEMCRGFTRMDNIQAYFTNFFFVLRREWGGVDYLRMNKFLAWIRQMMNEWMLRVYSTDFDEHVVQEFVELVRDQVLLPHQSDGIRMQVAFVYLTELMNVAGPGLKEPVLRELLSPFLCILLAPPSEAFLQATIKDVFDMLNANEFLMSSTGETKSFLNLDRTKVGAAIFDMAAADESLTAQRRKLLYALAKKFESRGKSSSTSTLKSNSKNGKDDEDDDKEQARKKARMLVEEMERRKNSSQNHNAQDDEDEDEMDVEEQQQPKKSKKKQETKKQQSAQKPSKVVQSKGADEESTMTTNSNNNKNKSKSSSETKEEEVISKVIKPSSSKKTPAIASSNEKKEEAREESSAMKKKETKPTRSNKGAEDASKNVNVDSAMVAQTPINNNKSELKKSKDESGKTTIGMIKSDEKEKDKAKNKSTQIEATMEESNNNLDESFVSTTSVSSKKSVRFSHKDIMRIPAINKRMKENQGRKAAELGQPTKSLLKKTSSVSSSFETPSSSSASGVESSSLSNKKKNISAKSPKLSSSSSAKKSSSVKKNMMSK